LWLGDVGSAQVGVAQDDFAEVGSAEIGVAEVGVAQSDKALALLDQLGLMKEVEDTPFSRLVQSRQRGQRPYPCDGPYLVRWV
jgi:hypothetical protein